MLAFVFGGGGSRGALQIGALEALFAVGIRPDLVIGTSVGAINAAFLASDPTCGGVQRLKEIWLHVRQADVYAGSNRWAISISSRPPISSRTTFRKPNSCSNLAARLPKRR